METDNIKLLFFPKVLNQFDLTHNARLCFAVCTYFGCLAMNKCFVSQDKIAEILGVDPRTVRNGIRELETQGICRTVLPFEDERSSNETILLWHEKFESEYRRAFSRYDAARRWITASSGLTVGDKAPWSVFDHDKPKDSRFPDIGFVPEILRQQQAKLGKKAAMTYAVMRSKVIPANCKSKAKKSNIVTELGLDIFTGDALYKYFFSLDVSQEMQRRRKNEGESTPPTKTVALRKTVREAIERKNRDGKYLERVLGNLLSMLASTSTATAAVDVLISIGLRTRHAKSVAAVAQKGEVKLEELRTILSRARAKKLLKSRAKHQSETHAKLEKEGLIVRQAQFEKGKNGKPGKRLPNLTIVNFCEPDDKSIPIDRGAVAVGR